MKDVYAYTADKINRESERNQKLYDSASGKHQEFSLGETVYVRLDRQSFTKVKNKKWIKCWKDLSLECCPRQLMRCNMSRGLKGVRSQAQKDILAEAQQRQETALSGRHGVSYEPDAND